MRELFNCTDCGKCCISVCTQIELTVCDVIRISEYLKIPVSGLFKKHIGFNPFISHEDIYLCNYSLGLDIPCVFYDNALKKDKCKAYSARSLNCRLFPFAILLDFDAKGINDPTTDCLVDVNLTDEQKKDFTKYCDELIKIMDQEKKLSKEIMERLGCVYSIDLSGDEDYKEIISKGEAYKNKLGKDLGDKKMVTETVEYCKSIFSLPQDSEIPKLLEKELNDRFLRDIAMKNLVKLNEIDKIFKK